MADRLIDIGLILFFGGFSFVCYINGVCGIGKDYMQRNKIDFVRWIFSPRHILRSNTPFAQKQAFDLQFLRAHHTLCDNRAVFSDLCGSFSILRGASH